MKTFVRGRLVAEEGELLVDTPEGKHVDGVAMPTEV